MQAQYTTQVTAVNQFGNPPPVMTQPVAIQQTTVVVNQPGPTGWNSGLMACCDDMGICCCVCLLGNCYYCTIATRMGDSACVGLCGYPGGWVPGGHLAMRSAFRNKHGIPGTICSDCCAVTWCLPCVMCQIAREMDSRNYTTNGCC